MYVESVVIAATYHFHRYTGSSAFKLMVYVSGLVMPILFHVDGSRCGRVLFISNSNTSFTDVDRL